MNRGHVQRQRAERRDQLQRRAPRIGADERLDCAAQIRVGRGERVSQMVMSARPFSFVVMVVCSIWLARVTCEREKGLLAIRAGPKKIRNMSTRSARVSVTSI